MKKLLLVLTAISLIILIWGILSDTSAAITAGLVFSGCCIGNYIGATLKEKKSKQKPDWENISHAKTIILSCILFAVIVISTVVLLSGSIIPNFQIIEIPDRLSKILVVLLILLSLSIIPLSYLLKRKEQKL